MEGSFKPSDVRETSSWAKKQKSVFDGSSLAMAHGLGMGSGAMRPKSPRKVSNVSNESGSELGPSGIIQGPHVRSTWGLGFGL